MKLDTNGMPVFEPTDFERDFYNPARGEPMAFEGESASAMATQALHAFLKEQPPVFGFVTKQHKGQFTWWSQEHQQLGVNEVSKYDTHTAYIFGIRKLEGGENE